MTHARICKYLHELAGAVEETAADLRLLPLLLGLLLLAPRTLVELALFTQGGSWRDPRGFPGQKKRAARRAARDNLVITSRRYTLKQGETGDTGCIQNKPVSIQ
jgi:hypothetical protein